MCSAVQCNHVQLFVEKITQLANDVQFHLKYLIEIVLQQMERGGLTQRLGELLMQRGTHPCTFSGYLSSLSLIPFSFLFFFFHFSFSSFLSFLCHFSFPLFLISFPCIDLSLGFGLHFFTLPVLFLFSYFPFTELSIDSISSSCLLQCLFTNSFHQFAFAPFNFLSLTQRHSNISQCL